MIDQRFNPAEAESRIYAAWERAGCFRPSGDTSVAAYSIVIPPPNVTGVLHMGHALNHTLQDILIRFERMRGKNVLWQPGTDHAGIATQMVVERQLAEDGNVDRRTLGREAFLKRVWAWKETSGGAITGQLKRLGASCDWEADRFTMDEGLSRAVTKVFVALYNKGLIYRAKRLVNWDPHFQTAISDLEVEMREVDGHYWHLKYPLADGVTYDHPIKDDNGNITGHETRDYLVVATSRPETMLGDTGVAVHPDDARYASLIGKHVILPIVGRRVPVIADAYANPQKGSGAVKITPAHDFNDFEVGKRAGHAPLNILTATAQITDGPDADAAGIPQELRGLDRFAARRKVVEAFEAAGLLERIEAVKIEQPFGDRSGVVIEPWLTDQWYVDAAALAGPARKAVEDGTTRFIPENWTKIYYNWLDNIQPWCVSRQLWWGHRIPVWYGPDIPKGGILRSRDDWGLGFKHFVATSVEEAVTAAAQYYDVPPTSVKVYDDYETFRRASGFGYTGLDNGGGKVSEIDLFRDTDVLDTWFSSALWPFSTQGWPDETERLKTFYPTTVLVTAFDIIFFWVARMMMMGLEFTGKAPFRDVYIHALVLDEKGQKMSKSKGNAMDPLELIEEFGADALRFTMAAMAAQGRNIRLSRQRVEGYRNFATKLWNAARFAEMNGCIAAKDFSPQSAEMSVNRWILGRLGTTAAGVTRALEAYRFNEAAGALYGFIWNDLCDWYLELIKPVFSGDEATLRAETQATCAYVIDETLKLLHPFMPFVTEELWERRMPGRQAAEGFLMLQRWPSADAEPDQEAEEEISWLIELISEIRSLRNDLNVPAAARIPLTLVKPDARDTARCAAHADALKRLARIDSVAAADEAPKGAVSVIAGTTIAALGLAEFIDAGEARKRLDKELTGLEKELVATERKLANADFVARAPIEIVEENRERIVQWTLRRDKLSAARKSLETL